MIAVHLLPAEIRASRRAVVWKREFRDGKATKVPYIPHCPDQRAAVDDPATWGSFDAALAAVVAGKADGAGIVLGDGVVGVDVDDCRDPETGALTAEALAIVQALDSYTEVSPSRTGLHVLVRGSLPAGRRRKGDVEMYAEARYFTITGRHLDGTPTSINERTAAVAVLHARIFETDGYRPRQPPLHAPATLDLDDRALLARAHGARNGAKFGALWRGDTSAYSSHSEADQALTNMLCWWAGGDAGRVDALFRRSGLMRPKWDARRGSVTYGERTITTAIASVREGE